MDYLKIGEKPLIYQINLLKPSNWFYLSIYYKAGYVFENKINNQLPHLFEHYLFFLLIKGGIPENYIKAYVDKEFIEFDFRFPRKKLSKYLKIIINNIVNLDFSYQNILEREKKVVHNEVMEINNNNLERYSHHLIEEQLLTKNCPYVKAYDYFQSNLIQKLTINDLKNFYNSRIRFLMPTICFGGYKITKDELHQFKELLLKVDWGSCNEISFPQCQIMTNQIKDIKNKHLNKGVYLVFAFPISNFNKLNFIQKKAIRILLEDIVNHPSPYNLEVSLREIGIYKTSLEIFFYQKFGYFYYSIFVEHNQIIEIAQVFKKTIEYFKKKDNLYKIIKESIKDISSQRKIDNDNEKRFFYFSDILVKENDVPLNDKKYIKTLFSLKPLFWKKLINNLFDWNKINILIIHNGLKKTELKLTKNTLSHLIKNF